MFVGGESSKVNQLKKMIYWWLMCLCLCLSVFSLVKTKQIGICVFFFFPICNALMVFVMVRLNCPGNRDHKNFQIHYCNTVTHTLTPILVVVRWVIVLDCQIWQFENVADPSTNVQNFQMIIIKKSPTSVGQLYSRFSNQLVMVGLICPYPHTRAHHYHHLPCHILFQKSAKIVFFWWIKFYCKIGCFQ